MFDVCCSQESKWNHGCYKRTFTNLDMKCISLLYKLLVCSHLKYGVIVWFPHKMKDTEAIERAQRRATKQIKQIRHIRNDSRN